MKRRVIRKLWRCKECGKAIEVYHEYCVGCALRVADKHKHAPAQVQRRYMKRGPRKRDKK